MDVDKFIQIIGADFFTGVPDSQLKALCNYLFDKYGVNNKHHIIAANEGNSVALAAGYHLSTGKVPVVYMQNSGEGNAINPITSLINDNVYATEVGGIGIPFFPDDVVTFLPSGGVLGNMVMGNKTCYKNLVDDTYKMCA